MKSIRFVFFSIFAAIIGLGNGVVLSQDTLSMPKRSEEPWRDAVARIQREYLLHPEAERFARLDVLTTAKKSVPEVIYGHEGDPLDAVLVEWWCGAPQSGDEFDLMWMEIIAAAARTGAIPYVYLYSYYGLDDDTALQACGAMLKEEHGIDPDAVVWIQDYDTDAFWMRDFGPLAVREKSTQVLSLEDPIYYVDRPYDDAMPVDFATRFEIPITDFNLNFEGGNLLANGRGLCITSAVTLYANPQYSEDEIRQIFDLELGCHELVIVDPLEDYATGHVDMWLAFANPTTLIVGEYEERQDAINRAIIEANLTTKLTGLTDPESGAPIEIVRMPMPSNCPPPTATHPVFGPYLPQASDRAWVRGEQGVFNAYNATFYSAAPQSCPAVPGWYRVWRTYLNVGLINNTVLLPVYRQSQRYQQEATRIWESLGYEVVPVKSDWIIYLAGSIHCIMQTIGSPTL